MTNIMIKKTGGHIARAVLIAFCMMLALMSWPGTFAVQPSQAGIAGTVAEKICTAKMRHVFGSDKPGAKSIDDIDGNHAISCNGYISICLQESGVLNKGESIGHTADGHSKGTVEDCVSGYSHLKAAADAGRCTYEFFPGGTSYSQLDSKYKQAGCVYIDKGTSNLNVGEDKIYGCQDTTTFSDVTKDMERNATFNDSGQCAIMVVIIPSHENSIIGAAYAAEEEEAEDYDLYSVSSNAGAAFQDALGSALTKEGEESSEEGDFEKGAPQAKDMINVCNDGTKTGNVCSYLGFVDDTKTKGKFKLLNVWQSKRTASSATFSYKQFRRTKAILTGKDVDGAYGFQSYANYGRMLADLGIDTTGAGTSVMRRTAGYAMMGAYLLASAVPFIFGYIAKFLTMLNPFVLVGEGANKLAASNSSLSELGKWTSNLWDILQDMSLFIIIPLFFAFSFGIALISHQPGGGSRIGNSFFQFIVRLIFITIAIPITGAIYTGFLNQLSGLAGYGTNATDGVVYSELIDFQGWASKTRLAPPSNVNFKWDTEKGAALIPDGSIREVAIKINGLADHKAGDSSEGLKQKFTVPTGFGMYDLSRTQYTSGKYDKEQSTSKAMELLKRYANGDVYSSSAFASEVNADRQALMTRKEEEYDKYKKMFLEGDVEADYPYALKPESIFGNGRLACSTDDGTGVAEYNWHGASGDSAPEAIAGDKKSDRVSTPGGLSTVGMYNYLNSKFDDSEITVYSSKKSTSEYVKDSHFAVSALGSGIWRWLWFAQSFVTLLCMAVIGLIYAVSLVMTGFRQGGKMLVSIPGAALGSMAFIGRFCAAFFVMIADILITIVFYSIFCELLQVLNEATSNIIPSATSSIAINVGGTSMPFMIGFSPLNFLGVIFSIFLILYVTWMAIRNRVVFIRSVDEVVSGSIGRMLGVKHGIGRGKRGSLLGAAAGTAAGVAAGHMLNNKLDGIGKGDTGGAKGGGDGSGGVGGLLSSAVGGSADDGSGGVFGGGGEGGVLGGITNAADAAGLDTSHGVQGFNDSVGNKLDSFADQASNGAMVGDSGGVGKMLGVDDLDNVNAETGVISGGGVTEAKSATGVSASDGSGAAGIAGRGGVVGSNSVNASKTAGGGAGPKQASAGTVSDSGGGGSTQSAGAMPQRSDPKSAKFFEGADRSAASVIDAGAAAQAKDGFVRGMQSGAFKNGEFTGNAKSLSGFAQNGAKAASMVDTYNNSKDEEWKKQNRSAYMNAKRQMARSQVVLARAGVKGADSTQYMSPAQWNNVAKNISGSYANHQQGQQQVAQTPGRITGQRSRAPGRAAQPSTGPTRGGGRSRA